MITSLEKRILSLAIYGASAMTIAVSPMSSFDPINPIKILILSTLAFALLGIVLSSFKRFSRPESKLEIWVFTLFAVALFIPIVFADAPVSQQFWGTFGRNTGFLTYISLAIVAFALGQITLIDTESRIIKYFLITNVILAIYGVIQLADLDFIGWSQKNVFATLGNVNFFSAFLGISLVVLLALIFGNKDSSKKSQRFGLITLFVIESLLLYNTDSVQGIVTAIFGAYVVVVLLIYRSTALSLSRLAISATALLLVLGFLPALGFLGQGPLSRILYQDSNFFRLDYMHAGLEMTLKNPLTGVGLDSYDNWYREERGFISAFRTNMNRTSNTAHNIFLDISSGGGFFLFFAYCLIIAIVGTRTFALLRKNRSISDCHIALVAGWLGYQFQSLLSINQIGLGIWGWIFAGGLLAISLRERTITPEAKENKVAPKKKMSSRSVNVIPPLSSIFAVLGMSFGFFLSYLPFSTDAAFREASDSRDLSKMIPVVQGPASNAFQLGKTLEGALQTGENSVIDQVSALMANRFPREIFAWDVRSRLQNISAQDREAAIQNVRNLDPFQICFLAEPSVEFSALFDSLELGDKSELLGWWGFVGKGEILSPAQIAAIRSSDRFVEYSKSICGR